MVSRKKSRVQASKMTTFTTAQRIWIVEESSKLISPVKIKREFVKRYSIAPVAASKLKGHHFSRILQRFKETCLVATKKRGDSRRSICIPINIEKLWIHINDDPTVSIAQAAQHNNSPVSFTYRMIRNDLKLFLYKFHEAQVLTIEHKDQRLKFCRWFCENDIDPQSVIFSDEK